jgi:hypothetical protein
VRAEGAQESAPTPARRRRDRAALAVTLATLAVVVGRDFFSATTFIGDDHLFLTFARAARHPLVPFVRDCHGGEYYRPIPMALWWLLARAGGGREWVFALFALGLHALVAGLIAALARALGSPRAVAVTAGALFFVAPAEREAALWFSASTDLLATAAVLGSVVCAMRGTRAAWRWSLVLAAVAYLSKETALVLPALVAVMTAAAPRSESPAPSPWRRILPHAVLALLYLVARTAVLHGPGGAGDQQAPLWARALQLAHGLVHALVGDQLLPALVTVPLGIAVLVWCATARERPARAALAWIAIALVPLPLAGWVVGARYFYLPAVGLALLLSRRLWGRGPAPAIVAVGLLLVLGSAGASQRRREVAAYRARVAAAAQAVLAEAAQGHRLFHVRSGIKDLDLVLKNLPAFAGRDDDLVVLSDVPASFVLMPPRLATRLAFLRAAPPLPPAGAYHFGPHLVVGLARRDESPDLDDVIARLPELRFLELAQSSIGITWHDVTANKRP